MEYRLDSQRLVLEERLHELNAAILGMPHNGHHVNSCRPTWLAFVHKKVHKTSRHASATRDDAKPAKSIEARKKTRMREDRRAPDPIKFNIPDEVVGADTPAWTPPPTSHASRPIVTAPTPDRPYTGKSAVRVIGPLFLPNDSKDTPEPIATEEKGK